MDLQKTPAMAAATEKLCLQLHSHFGEPVRVPPEFDPFVLKDKFVLELLLSVETAVQATLMMEGKSCEMNMNHSPSDDTYKSLQ